MVSYGDLASADLMLFVLKKEAIGQPREHLGKGITK